MAKTKKVKAAELLLKLRDAVVRLLDETKQIKINLEALDSKVNGIEKKLAKLESTVINLKKSSKMRAAPGPSISAPAKSSGTGDLELEDLARQIGIDLTPALGTSGEESAEAELESPIPAPPPPPPIGEVRKATTERRIETPKPPETPSPQPSKPPMDLLTSEEALGVKQAEEEDLEKAKDELLKALKELDELK